MTHELKITKKHFQENIYMGKDFEIRKNDRNFHIGDIVILNEIDEKEKLTDRLMIVKITKVYNINDVISEHIAFKFKIIFLEEKTDV